MADQQRDEVKRARDERFTQLFAVLHTLDGFVVLRDELTLLAIEVDSAGPILCCQLRLKRYR